MKINQKFVKTVGVFIGLKMLELLLFPSIVAICWYLVECISVWDLGIVGQIIGNIIFWGFWVVVGLLVTIGIALIIRDWIKSNWVWAKEIVEEGE